VVQNDILRRLRYLLDYDDIRMMRVFAAGGIGVPREFVCDVLRPDSEPGYRRATDRELSAFLNGLIMELRGKREGPKPQPDETLNNNQILQKLKIAFALRSEAVLALLAGEGVKLSPHELSSFFRKPGHKHYRECMDQVMRNLLTALTKQRRGDSAETT